jgi:hypothetical protein
MAGLPGRSGLGRGFGAVRAMTDEELLISKGWEKEDSRDPRCWYRPREFGRYDLRSALKIQKWLEVGKEARIETKTR